jgi:hypothetical protein
VIQPEHWRVVNVAAGLMSTDTDQPNVEYDRALVEMTCDLIGVSDRQAVQDFLLALARLHT